MFRILVLSLVVFVSQLLHAQRPPMVLSDSTSVCVLTCDRGNELYSLYGHTALRIVDHKADMDWVINYGTFDFATPNFGLKFAKGDLQYFVSVAPYADFLTNYQLEGRAVKEQVLALTATEKQQIWTDLIETITSDKRFYTYKFIDRNCTTMVKDLLEKHTGSSIVKVGPIDHTYRDLIYPEFRYHFWEKLGTQLLFGPKVDKDAQALFLPEELFQALANTTFKGQKAVVSTSTPIDLPTAEPDKLSFFNTIWCYLLLIAVIAFVPWEGVRKGTVIVLGILGLGFVFAGFYSLHEELQWNWQILLCNPLWLVVVGTKNPRLKGQLVSVIQLGLFVYTALVCTKIHFVIVAPLIVLSTYIAWKIYRQSRLLAAVK